MIFSFLNNLHDPALYFLKYLTASFYMLLLFLYLKQFAMGLNMPAKTVVFTSVKKWDGDSHRYIGSGEYIQVIGGLRGCIIGIW